MKTGPKQRPFESFIDKDIDGHWYWRGSITNGYGYYRHNKKWQPAHRVAYKIYRSNIPDDMQLDHLCRIRHCVNPKHLEIVTQKENMRRGKRTKLMSREVEEIKDLLGSNLFLHKEIALFYNVSRPAISHIQQKYSWSDKVVSRNRQYVRITC